MLHKGRQVARGRPAWLPPFSSAIPSGDRPKLQNHTSQRVPAPRRRPSRSRLSRGNYGLDASAQVTVLPATARALFLRCATAFATTRNEVTAGALHAVLPGADRSSQTNFAPGRGGGTPAAHRCSARTVAVRADPMGSFILCRFRFPTRDGTRGGAMRVACWAGDCQSCATHTHGHAEHPRF